MIQSVTKDNFDNEILKAQIPVVVDFYADWCGPCKMMSPLMEKLSGEYEGKVKFCKVNVDDEEELAIQNKVQSIPLFVLYKDGQVIDKAVGARAEDEMRELISKAL